jgi:hypothetical protein
MEEAHELLQRLNPEKTYRFDLMLPRLDQFLNIIPGFDYIPSSVNRRSRCSARR